MHKIFVTILLCLCFNGSLATVHAADNQTFFEALIPDNASLSAVKESGSLTLDTGEEVLENIVEDGKGLGGFLLKKAGQAVEGTKNAVKNLTE